MLLLCTKYPAMRRLYKCLIKFYKKSEKTNIYKKIIKMRAFVAKIAQHATMRNLEKN